jgi:hypothetical protein
MCSSTGSLGCGMVGILLLLPYAQYFITSFIRGVLFLNGFLVFVDGADSIGCVMFSRVLCVLFLA